MPGDDFGHDNRVFHLDPMAQACKDSIRKMNRMDDKKEQTGHFRMQIIVKRPKHIPLDGDILVKEEKTAISLLRN